MLNMSMQESAFIKRFFFFLKTAYRSKLGKKINIKSRGDTRDFRKSHVIEKNKYELNYFK